MLLSAVRGAGRGHATKTAERMNSRLFVWRFGECRAELNFDRDGLDKVGMVSYQTPD